MKFPYQEFEVLHSPSSKRHKKVFRPVIPVILIYSQRIVGYEALIDSGADYNIFDAGISDTLGIKLTTGRKRHIAGIGGQKIKGYEHKVTLRVGDRQYHSKIIFSKQIPAHSFGVLGNQGFFNHFKVNFNFREKIIILH